MNAAVLALLVLGAAPGPGDFQAGVASKVISPPGSIWMAGYAARTRPSDEVLHDLHAKALALRDERGERLVIVTADLIALPRDLCNQVAQHARKKHGLERSQVLFNASHTHAAGRGPRSSWRAGSRARKVLRYRTRPVERPGGSVDRPWPT